MSRLPYLPLWTDDYLGDTGHLNAAEHGAYFLLLMEAWRRPKCDLPDDDGLLARFARMTPEAWAAAKPIVMAFWKRNGRSRTWTQNRLTIERDRVTAKKAIQSDNAAKRWKNKKKEDATALPRQSHGNAAGIPFQIPDTLPIGKGAEAPPAAPIEPDPPSPPDPGKVLFDAGMALLRAAGMAERSARALVARWRRDHGDAWTREAIVSAQGKSDPVAWIEGRRRSGTASEDEARAASSATAERYRRMAMPGPPPGGPGGLNNDHGMKNGRALEPVGEGKR